MRVLVTGMGGELGTRVANLLEADETVTEIVGIDSTRRGAASPASEFHRVDPRDRRKAVHLVRDLDPDRGPAPRRLRAQRPHRPHRGPPRHRGLGGLGARRRRRVPVAPAHRGAVRHRGLRPPPRGRHPARRVGAARPHLAVRRARWPTSRRWRSRPAGSAGVPVTSLRFAPIVGPSIPSPLGRYLRLPVVAFDRRCPSCRSACCTRRTPPRPSSPPPRAARRPAQRGRPRGRHRQPGRRLGGRIPLPVLGPGGAWPPPRPSCSARRCPPTSASCSPGAASADGALARRGARASSPGSTHDVVRQLYRWGDRGPRRPAGAGARPMSRASSAAACPAPGRRPPCVARAPTARYDVDEWGLDPELVALADPVLGPALGHRGRTAPSTCPRSGGAVLVSNRRFGLTEPWVLARGVRQATGRLRAHRRRARRGPGRPVPPPLRRRARPPRRGRRPAARRPAGGPAHSPATSGREQAGAARRSALLEAAFATGVTRGARGPGRPRARAGPGGWRSAPPVDPPVGGGPLAAAELAEATRRASRPCSTRPSRPSWWYREVPVPFVRGRRRHPDRLRAGRARATASRS